MMSDKDKINYLIVQNLQQAAELDMMDARLKYCIGVIEEQTRILDDTDIPVPEYAVKELLSAYQQDIEKMTIRYDQLFESYKKIFGGDVSPNSAGIRTGETQIKITEEEINNLLSDLDPEIVKKMG